MNDIAILKNQELNLSDPQILGELKKMYGHNVTDTEWLTFLGICKATGLNPIKREIWVIKFGSAPASIFVARDGYRIGAFRNPNYKNHRVEAVYSNDEFTILEDGSYKHSFGKNAFVDRGSLVGAYCIVGFKNKDITTQVMVRADEYIKRKKDGDLQGNWATMPETMLKKVAEAQTLRMAFPEQFNGTYSEAEKDLIDVNETQTEKLKRKLNEDNNKTKIGYNTFKAEKCENKTSVGEARQETSNAVNEASQSETISLAHLKRIKTLIEEKNISQERIQKALNYYKVPDVNKLNQQQAVHYITMMEKL